MVQMLKMSLLGVGTVLRLWGKAYLLMVQMWKMSPLGVGTVLRLEKRCVVYGQTAKASNNNECVLPPSLHPRAVVIFFNKNTHIGHTDHDLDNLQMHQIDHLDP